MNITGILWRRTSIGRFLHRLSNNDRSITTCFLRPLWPDTTRSVQRDGGHATKRQDRQEPVLRGNTDTVRMFDEQCVHGYVYRHGNAPRQATTGYDTTGNDIGVSPCGTDICAQRMFDGQQNAARSKAIEKRSSRFPERTCVSKRIIESGGQSLT